MDYEINDLMDDEEKQGDNDNKTKSKNKSTNDNPVTKRKSNPRVTLNAERLTGERGIAQLPKIFSQVSFKGKGYEKQDLDLLLKTMEHWSHRLFPKLKFNDVIEKIEVLGTKRPVQTCLRKLRLEMPILASDFVDDDDEQVESAEHVSEKENVSVVDDDIFDQIFGDVTNTSTSTAHTETQSSQPSGTLSNEERQKIAMNRIKALEKLKQKSQQETNISTEIQQNDESIATDEANDFLTESEMFELMEQDGGLL